MLKPTSEIKADLGIEPNGRVQRFFTQTCFNHMDKYVPKDTGTLRDTYDLKADSITYQSDYAKYQYYGNKMVMDNGKSAYYAEDFGYWSKFRWKETFKW